MQTGLEANKCYVKIPPPCHIACLWVGKGTIKWYYVKT